MSSRSSRKTFYDILGVASSADAKDIRKAYLKLSLKHHPDKNPPEKRAEAQRAFVEIGEAYKTLSDPQLRASYDRSLRFGGTHNNNTSHRAHTNETGFEPTYEDFRDFFDETMAGMSETELAVVLGAASLVGSIIGSTMASKARASRGSGTGNGRTGSSLWTTAGSLVGSAIASELATSSIKALHQDSVERVAYKEQCQVARQRGQPLPDPPTATNWKSKFEAAVQKTRSLHPEDHQSRERRQPGGNNKKARSRFQQTVEQVRDQAVNAALNNPELLNRVAQAAFGTKK